MWDYSDKVKEYFFNPKNAGVLEDANAVGDVGAIACGDALRLMLKVEPEGELISAARFQTFGCGSAIASSSALTEMVIGKTLDEALQLTNQDIADFLGGLPPEKMHCSVMGYEALRAAAASYRGEAWADDHEDGALLCRCFGVDEGMVERAIRNNKLTSLQQVTEYTKAVASCGTCADAVETVLARVNEDMVAAGQLEESAAFTLGPRKVAKALPMAEPKLLTNLQRIRLVEEAIEEVRPSLKRDGGDCELVDVEGDDVKVRLTGACVDCHLSGATVAGVQERLTEKLGRPIRVIPLKAERPRARPVQLTAPAKQPSATGGVL